MAGLLTGGHVAPALPSGYAPMAYIESSGTQYIDTGVIPTASTEVEMEIEVLQKTTGRNAWVFGSRNADAKSRYEIIWIDSASAYRFYFGSKNYTFSGVDATGKLNIRISSTTATINNVTVSLEPTTLSAINSMYVFSCNGGNAADETYSFRLKKMLIRNGGTLARDFKPCTNPSGEGGLYDLVSAAFFGNAGTGVFADFPANAQIAKSARLISPNGTRRVLEGHIIALNELGAKVARKIFTPQIYDFDYLGAVSKLSVLRYDTARAAAGNHALFAGGRTSSSTVSNVVDAFDEAFVRSTPDPLSNPRGYMGGATIGGVALLVGGVEYGASSPNHATAETYDETLVRSLATPLSLARYHMGSAVIGNHALFAGGTRYGESSGVSNVDVYDELLVHSTATPLSTALDFALGVTNGKYALFVNDNNTGGDINHRVVAYDEELTQFTPDTLVSKTYSRMAVRAGKYALIAGGIYTSNSGKSGPADMVEAYDESLVRYTITPLSVARSSAGVATIGDAALIVGGWVSPNRFACVDVYDESLIRYDGSSLSTGLAPEGVVLGDSALFAGGSTNDDVHVFQIP